MTVGSQLTRSDHRRERTLWRFLRIFLASWVVIGGSIVAIVATSSVAGANAPTPSAISGTVSPLQTGHVTVSLSGTWIWSTSPATCSQRTGVGWSVGWWGIGTDPSAPTNNFSLSTASLVKTTGTSTLKTQYSTKGTPAQKYVGTISQATLALALKKKGSGPGPGTPTGEYFYEGPNLDGYGINNQTGLNRVGVKTCTTVKLPTGGTASSGPWSATATYPNTSDIPPEICVNMYDLHQFGSGPGGRTFNPTVDKDNSITTNAFTPSAAGYCFKVPKPTTTTTTVTLGATGKISDSALVTGTSTNGAPTGSVAFHVCGPATSTEYCHTGVSGYTAVATTTEPSSTTTSTATYKSGTFPVTTSGVYCFSAVYSGNAKYLGSSDNTGSTGKTGGPFSVECVTVTPVTPKTTTHATTLHGTTVLGKSGTISDTATITGVKGARAPAGTVTFYKCFTASSGPNTCSTATGMNIGTVTMTRDATATPPRLRAISGPVSATKAGWYCFGAVFRPASPEEFAALQPFFTTVSSGATTNYTGSSDNTSGTPQSSECVHITQTIPPPSPPPSTPKFTVTKSDTPGSGNSVVPGGTIAYRVVVDNVGSAAGTATVTDPLPLNVTLTGTPTCATVTSGDTCSVSVSGTTLTIKVHLASDDSAKATFDAVVKSTDTTTVVNTATITKGPCTSPHCSSTVTNPVVVLSVVKSSTPPSGSTVPRGTKVTYALTLTDSGTAATAPITLTDKVPAGTTYVSGSATCGSAPGCTVTEKTGTVTWTGIVVQPGASNALVVNFQAVVRATDTTGHVITNVAVFTNDGTPSCTTSTCTTNRVTLKVTVPSSAATHSAPPTLPPPAPPVPVVPAATTPHTGEPWAGSHWLELMVLVAGLGLLVSGETLRRRRRAKAAAGQ